jgi:hypothetical protein
MTDNPGRRPHFKGPGQWRSQAEEAQSGNPDQPLLRSDAEGEPEGEGLVFDGENWVAPGDGEREGPP